MIACFCFEMISMFLKIKRIIDLWLMGLVLAALLISWGLSWWWQWTPCLLCLLQRIFFVLMFSFLFFSFVLRKYARARCFFSGGYFLVLLLGLFFASYHVFLEHMPPGQATCLPDWRVMWDYMSWSQIMHVVAQGDGHCRDAAMHRWFFSLPVWVLLFYFLLIVIQVAGSFYARYALKKGDV